MLFFFCEPLQVSCEELLHLVDKYRCSVGEAAVKAHLSKLPITSHGKRKSFSNSEKKVALYCMFFGLF